MPKNKKFSRKIIDKGKKLDYNDVSHPFAFRKLPYRVQHSRPLDYRYIDYDYAGFKCQQYGISSARQYRAWQQFFKPAGFPSNPPRSYGKYWISWDDFLNQQNTFAGSDPESVKASELLPFIDAVTAIQSLQFETVNDYVEAWDDNRIPDGIPRQPQVRYKEFYPKGGWKYFLGKKIEHRLDAKKNLEPVVGLCQNCNQSPNILTLVICSQGATVLEKQIAANPELTAVKAYYWYHDYGQYVFELLDSMGTKQTDNSWLFPDLNALYYELGSVLEVYRPR